MKPYPQPILIRLSDVSDVAANTAHRSAYVTTTLPAIVQGLRNLECQPDPFNEFQGPDALFSRLLAALAGTTEYDAVMGNEVERLNAMLAEQVEKVETLRRERDEARAEQLRFLDSLAGAYADDCPAHELVKRMNPDVLALFAKDALALVYLADAIKLGVEWERSHRMAKDACDQIATPTPGAQA